MANKGNYYDEETLENYKEIRAIASKNWLNSAYVSLAKLDEVKAKVYNVDLLSDARKLKPKPINNVINKHQLQMKPPISSVISQRTAWGSGSSIPDLVRQQSEKQRPESAKLLRPSRPASLKKRPESAKTPLSEHRNMRNKVIMAVKGGRYEASSRPPHQPAGTSILATGDHLHNNISLIQKAEKELPPAPCVSPDLNEGDLLVDHRSDDSDVDSDTIKERVHSYRSQQQSKTKSPALLRKPIHDPIHLRLPRASLDDEDDEIDTERLLEAADGTSLHTKPGFSYVHAVKPHQIHVPGTNGLREIDEEMGVYEDDDDESICLEDVEDVTETKRVKFDTDNHQQNDTAIPRSYHHTGRADLRNVKSRTDSGLSSLKTRPSSAPKYARPWSAKSDTSSRRSRPSSAKVTFTPTAVVVAYSDDDDDNNEEKMEKMRKKSLKGNLDDIETLVRGYRVGSDDSEDELAPSGEERTDAESLHRQKIFSEPERNYYELSKKSSENINESDACVKTKTVKTIELIDGVATEKTEVSAIDSHVVQVKPARSAGETKELVKPKEIWDKNGHRINKPEVKIDKKRPKSAVEQARKTEISASLFESPYKKPVACIHPYKSERTRSARGGVKIQKSRQQVATRPVSASVIKPSTKHQHSKKATGQEKTPKKVLYIETRDRDDIIRSNHSDGMRECKNMHFKLLEKGLDVSVDTLARALLPPQGTSVYLHSSAAQALPTNYSSGLLNSPAVWLSKEFRRLKLAEKALQRAEERLYMQRKNEELLAKGESVNKRKARKKSAAANKSSTKQSK